MTSFPALADIPMGELATTMGIVLTEATAERVVATMPVAGNRQPFGLLHGGASAVLAESAGSVHAGLIASAGQAVVGIELSCSHHRSARDGAVTAVSVPLHTGRQLVTLGIDVTDEDGREICTARLTCFVRPAG